MYVRSNFTESQYARVTGDQIARAIKAPFVSVSTWNGDTAAKQALDLNGSSSVTLNDHDRYAFGLNDFTIEARVSQDTFSGAYSEFHFLGRVMEVITSCFLMIHPQTD